MVGSASGGFTGGARADWATGHGTQRPRCSRIRRMTAASRIRIRWGRHSLPSHADSRSASALLVPRHRPNRRWLYSRAFRTGQSPPRCPGPQAGVRVTLWVLPGNLGRANASCPLACGIGGLFLLPQPTATAVTCWCPEALRRRRAEYVRSPFPDRRHRRLSDPPCPAEQRFRRLYQVSPSPAPRRAFRFASCQCRTLSPCQGRW